jgi:hypothetical protein
MISVRLAQRKTFTDPARSRDNTYKSQKEDTKNFLLAESLVIAGMPAIYFEEKDKDIQIQVNVVTLYTDQFEASLICPPEVTKKQIVKASEIIAVSLKKIL